MARHIVLFLLSVVWPAVLTAQDSRLRYDIAYSKLHLLCRRGAETNVVDVDLEWPMILNGATPDSLQALLSRVAFGRYSGNLEHDKAAFLAHFGTPVTSRLDSLPDDRKFCYVRCKVQQLGYSPDRFISFRVEYDCQPEPLSSQQAESRIRFVTYDMTSSTVLQEDEVMNLGQVMDNPYEYPALLQYLSSGSRTAINGEVQASSLLGPAFSSTHKAVFEVFYDNGAQSFLTDVPVGALSGLFKRKARKMLKATPVAGASMQRALTTTPDTDSLSIYQSVDEPPIFRQAPGDLLKYISQNYRMPKEAELEEAGSRVVVRFVVEPDGSLSNFAVLAPAAPSVDRALISCLQLSAGWKPGRKDGKPVRTAYVLPVVFRASE